MREVFGFHKYQLQLSFDEIRQATKEEGIQS
jgi:hypothetical protein